MGTKTKSHAQVKHAGHVRHFVHKHKPKLFFLGGAAALVGGTLFFVQAQAGPVTVTLLPQKDAVVSTKWVPNVSGASHFDMVNEPTCNGNTDYVSSITGDIKEEFALDISSIPAQSGITKIEVTPCAGREVQSGKGASNMNVSFYFMNPTGGGVSKVAGNYSLSNPTPSVLTPTVLWSKEAGDTVLKKLDGNTLQVGAVLVNDKNAKQGVRLSAISAKVTYIPDYFKAPAAPSNVAGTYAGGGKINLTWTDNATDEKDYHVGRSLTVGGPFVELAVLPADSKAYTDAAVVEGKSYYYQITAKKESGSMNFSNSPKIDAVIPAPVAFGSVTAAVESNDLVKISWKDANSFEAGYLVERAPKSSQVYAKICDLPPATGTGEMMNCDDTTGILDDVAYLYRVTAYNSSGKNSTVTSVVKIASAPVAPSNLVVSANSTGTFLTWADNANNNTGYVLERSEDGENFSVHRESSVADPTFTGNLSWNDKTNMIAGTTYYYRVKNTNAVGESEYSATASVLFTGSTGSGGGGCVANCGVGNSTAN